jgi:hypothetical protein
MKAKFLLSMLQKALRKIRLPLQFQPQDNAPTWNNCKDVKRYCLMTRESKQLQNVMQEVNARREKMLLT